MKILNICRKEGEKKGKPKKETKKSEDKKRGEKKPILQCYNSGKTKK